MKLSVHETNALPPGTTIKRYTVIDLLGSDHQGKLYRAECVDTDASVMLYEYLPAGLATRAGVGLLALPGKADALAKAVAAFATRLRAVGLVGHPALPTLDDIWQDNATVYAVGPWRAGRALQAELASISLVSPSLSAGGGPGLDLQQLSTWARTVCDALSALHRHDLCHLNLSPAMIRVLDTGELQLPLPGAPLFSDEAPAWLAPEQHPMNPKPVGLGPWTDVYQLSALVHLLMTGQSPPTVMRRWEGAPLERLSEQGEAFPPEWLVATRKGLSMHASARPQSPERWLAAAGMPDRREWPRYDNEASGFATTARRTPGPAEAAGPESVPASADSATASLPGGSADPDAPPVSRPMELGTGHQPLPPNIQARLDRLEKRAPVEQPLWMWAFVLMAVLTLVMAIVIKT